MRKQEELWTSQYVNKNRRRKLWQRIVSILACVVVFCTTYALILPAITEEKESFCGFEEHVHTDACFAVVTETPGETVRTVEPAATEAPARICQLEEKEAHTHTEDCVKPAHTHTEACFGEPELICGLEEGSVHTHTDACFGEEVLKLTCTLPETKAHAHSGECYTTGPGELTCLLQESEGHSHDEDCYDEDGGLVCTLEVSEGHSHGEACYAEDVTILICGKEQTDGHIHGEDCYVSEGKPLVCALSDTQAHVHSDACYAEPALICGLEERETEEQVCTLEETEGHTHTADCYEKPAETTSQETLPETIPATENPEQTEPARELICGLEEHTHELICFSDKTADVETETIWEKTLPGNLTGVWREDVLAIAASQLGYEESTRNYIVENDIVYGYSRYGAWYGDEYGDWCAMFVSFCLHYAGVENMPYDSTCQDWIEELTEAELYTDEEAYLPQPGDVIFFDLNQNGRSNHVGLVETVTATTDETDCRITTIEGNSGDRVQRVTYNLTDGRILGYGRLPYQLSAEEQAAIDDVIAMIDAMPSADEIDAKMLEYEAAEDYEGLEVWYTEVCQQIAGVYHSYSGLSDNQKALITNADKLLELEYIWSVTTLEIIQSVEVYQINTYDTSHATVTNTGTVLFNGKSADDWGQTATFAWWTAIVVEEDANGSLYVSKIDKTGSSNADKSAYSPETANGFVLLIWHSTVAPGALDVEVGNLVSASFDRTQTGTYTGSSYGTVTFSDGQFKPNKDNAGKLDVVQGADTKELIEVNLYDYGSSINDLYDGNTKYPGYQQDNGSTSVGSSFSPWMSFNFGNNITSDLAAGHSGVTNNGGDINKTEKTYTDSNGVTTEYGNANIPINNAILKTLKNGYPALADGTSLDYLFRTSAYATQKNTANINGLFRHNAVTGAYTYNSRENHAQFNVAGNTFTLYKQLISSNFMMYPFGNFLPFNDIVKASTQASLCDRDYFLTIADSAQYKEKQGLSVTSWNEYGTLATQLKQFVALMDAKHGTNWDAYDAVNQYFTTAGLDMTFGESVPELRPGEPLMNHIYSIDYDEETDFFFGMEMKMNLMQPKDGMTGNDTNGDGVSDYPMEFYFTGDDDVWVYIDGVLFLDLSGIHRHVGGKIDFVNGKTYYYALDTATGDVSSTPYRTVTFEEAFRAAYEEGSEDLTNALATLNEKGTFKDYSTHTFNFYYMERGAGSGVCRINFNFPLLRQNSISVSKAVSSDTEIMGNPDYKFQVLKANSDGTKTGNLFIAANTEYTIYDASDNKIGTAKTDANGVLTLKAGQRAEFTGIKENAGKYYVRELLNGTVLEQYGNVTVSGQSTTTSNNVTVGSDVFTGMDSPVKDMSDGATAFRFTNDVDEDKLGELSISKILTEYSKTRAVKTFDVQVTLDGELLPVGTEYTVGEETRTVETAGIISIAAGEKITISEILAGTEFTVQETSGSAEGYTVTYSDSGGYTITVQDGIVKGIIKTSAEVQLVVTNSEKGATVTIPGTKSQVLYDGSERSYAFRLTEVTDQTGNTVKEGGISDYIASAVVKDGPAGFSFSINYVQVQMEQLPQIFYYRITEDPSSDNSFLKNSMVYVAQVTVNTDETGELMAYVSGMWKDGAEVSGISADFVNTLTGNLELEKIVDGGSEAQQIGFDFTITLDLGSSGLAQLPTTYPAVFYQADGSTVETQLHLTDGLIKLTEFKHGEKAVISGIPLGAYWKIEEKQEDGFIVKTEVTVDSVIEPGTTILTEGNIISGSTQVVYTNQQAYELPETGGTGTTIYTMAGMTFVLSALCLMYILKKRRKEVTYS